MSRLRVPGVLFCLSVLLGACAPALYPMGPPSAAPELEEIDFSDRRVDFALVAGDGVRLPVQVWEAVGGAPEAVYLGVHGFNDYANSFALPAGFWAKNGVTTYAYDQRGFGRAPHRGRWSSTETMKSDLRSAAAAIGKHHPGLPLYVVGVSMGGAVTMATLGDGPIPGIDGAILVGPAVWGREYMNPFERGTLWFACRVMPWLTLTGEGLNIQPSDNIPMLRRLARDTLIIRHTRVDTINGLVDLMDAAHDAAPRIDHTPVMMIYGLKDEIVPAEPVIQAMETLPERRGTVRALYPDGWHMMLRDLHAEVVWRDIVHWTQNGMASPPAALPSGADEKARELLAQKVPAGG